MIYQCYPKKTDEKSLFTTTAYEGFGLEPEVNDRLFKSCPELESAKTRMQLTEYACFLWHWRNKENPDSWFGTTSYNQLSKFETIFKDKEEVEDLCSEHEVIGWGRYLLLDSKGHSISLKTQADTCHPGLSEFIEKVLKQFGYEVPSSWYTSTIGFFANYWVMKNELFNEFMEFSWPMVKWSLNNVEDTEYFQKQHVYGTVSNAKATGYFMERLFIIWYLMRGKEPFGLGKLHPLYHNVVGDKI